MNTASPAPANRSPIRIALPAVLVLLVGGLFVGSLVILGFLQNALGAPGPSLLATIFATDSVQSWWYVTRAAGLTAYLLMWLSMVWGLAVSSKLLHPIVEGAYSYDFHEFLSLLGLGFVLLHAGVLLFDKFLRFSLLQVLIPFADSYRPFWVGLGIIGFYILLLVSVTFYLRSKIGTRAFRSIHLLSLLGYVGVTFHGLFAGTDSALGATRLVYIVTALVIVFMTGHWLVLGALTKREQKQIAEAHLRASRRQQRRPLVARRG